MNGAGPSGERGSTTVWIMSLGLVLMLLGGVAIDLWRILGDRRELAAVADSVAVAAASGIDLDAYRAGEGVRLDPVLARELGRSILAEQAPRLSEPPTIDFPDQDTVEVTLVREVPFTFLLLDGDLAPSFRLVVHTTTEARLRG